MIDSHDIYCIGTIGKPHGVKGEVNFRFVDDVFDREDADYLFLMVEGIAVPFFIEEYRFRGEETALIKFEDIDTQQQAAALTGCEVFYPRGNVEEDAPVSWASVVDFELFDNATQRVAGRIAGVDDTTINLLFELDNGQLVPATPELITHIDVGQRRVSMDIPEGLLDL